MGRDVQFFAQCRWPAKPHYAYDKTVQGLIDLYEYAGQGEALKLLEKITDWAAGHLDRSRKIPDRTDRDASATEWYTLSENLYRACQLTGDLRFKTFGDQWRYPSYWTTFSTPVPAAEGLHAYSHVNTLGSAAMAYAVTEYHNIIDFQDSKSLYVNLFVPSEATWRKDGEQIRIVQETGYPEEETSILTVYTEKEVSFELKFRVPSWCQGATAEINVSKINVTATPGTWCVIQRTWTTGDRIRIRIPMRIIRKPVDIQHPRRVAVTYGPVVLVRKHESVLTPKGEDPSRWIVPDGNPLEFRALQQPSGIFVPFYRLEQDIHYQMYFDLEQ